MKIPFIHFYEKDDFTYLDTHYYGGIKKYQWVTQPLALHGVVVKKDGSCVNISIGEREDEPVFVITDLLVHLASKQLEKKAGEVIEGEKLDILVGNCPIERDENLKEEKEAYAKALEACNKAAASKLKAKGVTTEYEWSDLDAVRKGVDKDDNGTAYIYFYDVQPTGGDKEYKSYGARDYDCKTNTAGSSVQDVYILWSEKD